jgi:DNA-binding YbaB/EbfC family protein
VSKRTTPSRQRGGAAKAGKPNVQGMMAQVQQMQQEMAAAQEQLAQETVSASAGGGMVTVVVTGDLRVTSVTIDPEAVDPEDVEMLADMVTAAVNEGLRAAQELAGSRMGGATEGLDLGGLGGLGLPGL